MEVRRRLHRWDLTPTEAIALQKKLRPRIVDCPLPPRPKLIAGADVAYSGRNRQAVAAVVILRLPGFEVIEEAWAVCEVNFPYVPGLLTFREGPAVLAAFSNLKTRPDVVIFDGQGRAHQRGIGLGAHMGLWLDLPTIGCAKSRLVGEGREPRDVHGSRAPLHYEGNMIGSVLRTRPGVKPLYISAGHMSDLSGAVRLVLACGRGYRLPEPTRLAHALVNRIRTTLESVPSRK
jgi:deoxyribonuclease V